MPTGQPPWSTTLSAVDPGGSPTVAPLRIGLISTYPPKLCGLATFSAALQGELERAGHRVDVVRIDDDDADEQARRRTTIARPATAELVNGEPESIRRVAGVLSRCHVAVVQHEYGIYGGPDGDEVLELLRALHIPSVVVLHTVLVRPTAHQHAVLVAVADLADRVVVMTRTARDRLLAAYPVDTSKVVVIPHGASLATHDPVGDRTAIDERWDAVPQLLTWGLLGPGKGIEHTIDALGLLSDLDPPLRYTVAGVTHPKVLARDGHGYRDSFVARARANGTETQLTIDETYRDVARLTRFVASASIVVLPYDSTEQVTSGVLVDAIAAGTPVIATAFPHAAELLATGAGMVVPHGDPPALAAAIRHALTEPGLLEAMTVEARRLAPSLSWTSVAGAYADLVEQLVPSARTIAI